MEVLLTIMVAAVIVSAAIALWIRHTLRTLDAAPKPSARECRSLVTPLPIAGVGDVDGFGDEYTPGWQTKTDSTDDEGPHAA